MVNDMWFMFSFRRRLPYDDVGLIAKGTDVIRPSKECHTFEVILHRASRFMECIKQHGWHIKNLHKFLGGLVFDLTLLMIEGGATNTCWISRVIPLSMEFQIEIRQNLHVNDLINVFQTERNAVYLTIVIITIFGKL